LLGSPPTDTIAAHQQFGRIHFRPQSCSSSWGTTARTPGSLNERTRSFSSRPLDDSACWEHWVKHYSDKGIGRRQKLAGMEGSIEQLRRDPGSFASLGLKDVVDHYSESFRA